MDHHFLLTYSVHPDDTDNDTDVEKANSVRKDIAKINDWTKQENVETVFTGEMWLTGDVASKRRQAIKYIENQFKPILEDNEAPRFRVNISCVLMVNDLGQSMSFDVSYP